MTAEEKQIYDELLKESNEVFTKTMSDKSLSLDEKIRITQQSHAKVTDFVTECANRERQRMHEEIMEKIKDQYDRNLERINTQHEQSMNAIKAKYGIN